MAGAGGGSPFPAGRGSEPGIRRHGAARVPARAYAGRLVLALLAVLYVAGAQAQVLSTRIWPARDYTRLTLETRGELKHSVFSVKDPERLVLEIETGEVTPALAELQSKVTADDPYIQGLRVARNRPGVVRVVLDLKAEVKPQIFTLKPIGE
jgi:N-acetylmuramoyl-L-alanine amidase